MVRWNDVMSGRMDMSKGRLAFHELSHPSQSHRIVRLQVLAASVMSARR